MRKIEIAVAKERGSSMTTKGRKKVRYMTDANNGCHPPGTVIDVYVYKLGGDDRALLLMKATQPCLCDCLILASLDRRDDIWRSLSLDSYLNLI